MLNINTIKENIIKILTSNNLICNVEKKKNNIIINIVKNNTEVLGSFIIDENNNFNILKNDKVLGNISEMIEKYLKQYDNLSFCQLKSSIDGLKLMHSKIKNYQFGIITRFIKSRKLLDLASGNANDLNRWYNNKFTDIIGIEYNEKSIETATERYENFKHKHTMNVSFFRSDLTKHDEKLTKYLDGNIFDVVTCNFAIHYFFKSEDSINNIFNIINKHLKPGGIFTGMAIDKNRLIKTYINLKKHENPKLEIKPLENFGNNDLIYGRKYAIRIGLLNEGTYFDEGESVEYLVDFIELTNLAKKNGFDVIMIKPFSQLFDSKVKMSKHEMQASILNNLFIYRKK